MVHGATFNTQRPSNVNDEDLDPDSTYPVRPRIGFTQMSFCVLNHEMWWLSQQCNIILPNLPGKDPRDLQSATFDEKVAVLSKFKQHLDEEFLVHLDLSNPLAWITNMVANLILKRFWLAAYHPLRHEQRATHYEGLTRERLLLTTVELMELAHCLESEPMTAQYEWFLKSWVQWHALAVALAELCVQNQGPLVQRAWNIIDTVFEPWAAHIADSRQGMLWRPIQKLSAKARRNRLGGSMMAPNQKTVGNHAHPMKPQSQPQPGRYDPLQRPNSLMSPLQTYMNPIEPLQHLTLQNPTLQPQLGQAPRAMMPQMLPETASQKMPVLTGSGISGSVGIMGESLGTINWAEWDEFMQDFEMENRPSGDRDFVQQDAKTLGLWF